MAIPKLLILTDPSLKIGTGPLAADLVELACVSTHVELTPDVSVTTIETFCGSVDYPGVVKWQLIATLIQSFDLDATEETLSAAVESGESVAFEVIGYKGEPVSATNPSWSGLVIPQPYSPINGDAGAESTVEIEWSVVGEPTKSITPGALLTAQKDDAKAAKAA